MQIDKRILLTKPESTFDKVLEEQLTKYTLKLSQILNEGLSLDNFGEYWDDCRVAGLAMRTNASAPDLIAFAPAATNLLTYGFDGNVTTEQAYFGIQLPHTYKEGSTIYPHVHWTPTDINAGTVIWYLEYTWASTDGTFSAPTTINGTGTVVANTAWKHTLTSLSTITGTGQTISSMLICRLYRTPTTDTYSGDAALLEFDIHYKVDALGSATELVK